VGGAPSKLEVLSSEVDAQDGKKLTAEEADMIRAAVGRLVDNLGPG